MSLRVDPKAGVIRFTIPPRTSQFSINRFLKQNRDWITERQKTLLPKTEIIDGSVISYRGIHHEIAIRPHAKRITEIIPLPPLLYIHTSREDPTNNLKRWMIDQARRIIEPLSYEKARSIGKTISKIDLRDTSSRWGSCSSDKRLMFSWRLIMAPDYVLDYVIAHEVAHLKHMDHSRQFWDVCYSMSDRPEEARAWLKQEGNSLMRYF
tara:strand:+ start:422 stop:1045 length:624 start_codon:yes stop_codon:yes gene_type:complete